MAIDRLNILQPPTIQSVTAPTTSTAVTKATATASAVRQESSQLGQVLTAAVATASKPLRNRELVWGARTYSQPMPLRQLLQGIVNQAPIHFTIQLNKFRQQLRERKSLPEILKSNGNDPLYVHLLLSEIANQARQQGDENNAEQAQAQIKALEAEYGEEIRTGLNIAPALSQSVEDPNLRNSLRKVYYQHLVKAPSLSNFIEAVLHLCGEANFLLGLRALQQALAEDIAKSVQLPQVGKLRSLMESLGCTSQLNNLVHGCSDLATRMATRNPATTLTGLMLAFQVLRLSSRSMNVADTHQLSEKAGGASPSLRLAFLNSLHLLIKDMPPGLWRDDKSRQTSLRNLQLVMSELQVSESPTVPYRRLRL